MLNIPLVGRALLLDSLLGNVAAYLHLYTTDLPILSGVTLEDFPELNAPGYAPVAISGWTPADVQSDGIAYSFADQITFTLTGPVVGDGDVYGYFVTDGSSGEVLWAERGLYAPYWMRVSGDKVAIFPAFTLPQLPGQTFPAGIVAGDGTALAGAFAVVP